MYLGQAKTKIKEFRSLYSYLRSACIRLLALVKPTDSRLNITLKTENKPELIEFFMTFLQGSFKLKKNETTHKII